MCQMISRANLKWASVLFLALLGPVLGVAAQEKIMKISVVVGDDSEVTEPFVRDHIRLKVGDVYTPKRTNEDVKNLMKSGRFADVRILLKRLVGGGVELTYEVDGWPLLKRVVFERRIFELDENGTQVERPELSVGLRFKESKLAGEVLVKRGQQYNDDRRVEGEKALRDFYIQKGYFPVKVTGEFDANKTLTFKIEEGERFKIDVMALERVDGPEGDDR